MERRARRSGASRVKAAAGTASNVINIAEARTRLPQIVGSLETGSARSVVIGRRGAPAAAIIPYGLAEALQSPDKKRQLAALIVENLLPGAPGHLKAPALTELSRLPKADLERLWGIDSLSMSKDRLDALKAKMSHPEALERLSKRHAVAEAIQQAHESGLYEVLEDATSRIEL